MKRSVLDQLNQLSVIQDGEEYLFMRGTKVLKRTKDEHTAYEFMRTEVKRIKGENGKSN